MAQPGGDHDTGSTAAELRDIDETLLADLVAGDTDTDLDPEVLCRLALDG